MGLAVTGGLTSKAEQLLLLALGRPRGCATLADLLGNPPLLL